MREFIKKVAFKSNILVAVLLLLSYLSAWVNPKYFWPVSLPGILFPFLFFINLFFVVFWIVTKKKYFLVSLVVLIIGYSFAFRFFQFGIHFGKKAEVVKTEKALKVLSFNVRLFNLYKWVDKSDVRGDIVKFIQHESPDIICLQEFYTREKGKYTEKNIIKMLSGIRYKYVKYSYRNKGISNFGIATLSKYPIINAETIDFPASYNQCVYTDIRFGKDTIRVYNTHLQSFRLLKQNYEFIDTLKFQYKPGQFKGFRDILFRVKTAVLKRATQADSVSASVARSKYPVIVCGDFNESPVSYSYQTISKGLKDAFMETGSGMGDTYFTKYPSFRLDYILHSTSLKAFNYYSPKLELSDHSPVICYIKKK